LFQSLLGYCAVVGQYSVVDGIEVYVAECPSVSLSANASCEVNIPDLLDNCPLLHAADSPDVDSVRDPDYVPSENDSTSSTDFVDCSVEEDSNMSLEFPALHIINDGSVSLQSQSKPSGDNVVTDHDSLRVIEQQSAVDSMTSNDSKIKVRTTSNIGGRKYDKKNYCFCCGAGYAKLPRHLTSVHGDECMVAEYVKEKDKKEKDKMLLKMRNLGNHYHNVDVLKKKEGEFIVSYRPTSEVDHTEYLRCRYCYGYFARQSLWKHGCPFSPVPVSENTNRKHVRRAATINECISINTDLGILLQGLRNDDVGKVVQNDALILSLGQQLVNKHCGDKELLNHIRGKMRYLGRLLLILRKKSGHPLDTMTDFIDPTKFEMIAEAAQECAGFNDTNHEFSAPSTAIKCGQLIKKIAEIKETKLLQAGDSAGAELCVQFAKVCERQWSVVSAVAARNLTDRKRTGIRYLPLTADVVKLSQFLTSEANKQAEVLDRCPENADAYYSLTQLLLAKLILFNRKRQGEVSRTTVEDWQKRGKADPSSETFVALTEFERSLLRVLERMEIRGKRGRTVPVLLTTEVTEWLSQLVQCRSLHVPAESRFLFATNAEQSHYRGSDVLRKFALQCGASKPALLTSTKLRKHVASMAQVLGLQPAELDSVANFMGHDIRVHTSYYRMPLDLMQIARVSKIFLAADTGRITEFSGKSLADITIDGNEEVTIESDNDDDDNEDDINDDDSRESDNDNNDGRYTEKPHPKGKDAPTKKVVSLSEADAEVDSGKKRKQNSVDESHRITKKPCTKGSNVSEATEVGFSLEVGVRDNEQKEQLSAHQSQTVTKKSRKLTKRKKWTKEEIDAVSKHFAKDIMNHTLPSKCDILIFLDETGLDRSWTNVKDHIRNKYLL